MEQNELAKRILAIEKRNRRVELDKMWETSGFRKLLIALSTYAVVGIYMRSIGMDRPWLGALIPAVGYLLSTMSLVYLKERWMEKQLQQASSK